MPTPEETSEHLENPKEYLSDNDKRLLPQVGEQAMSIYDEDFKTKMGYYRWLLKQDDLMPFRKEEKIANGFWH